MKFIISSIILVFTLFCASHAQWTQCNGPFGGHIISFASSDTFLFAEGAQGGVFRSSNNGNSWEEVNYGLPISGVKSLAASNVNLFAGTTTDGLFRSTNNGLSWAEVNIGSTSKSILALAAYGSNIFAGTEHDGMYVSLDNGDTWVQRIPGEWDSWVSTIVANGKSVIASTNEGIIRSIDSGKTWTKINKGLSSSVYIRSLVRVDTMLFIGADAGLTRSTDDGDNWSVVNKTLKQKDIRCISLIGSTLLIGVYGTGMYRSSDYGITLTPADSGLTENHVVTMFSKGSSVFVGTYKGGIFRTNDSGISWHEVNSGLTNHYITSSTALGTILFATGDDGCVYRSVNNGAEWTRVFSQEKEEKPAANALAVIRSKVFVGTNHGVYQSLDSGLTWTWTNVGSDYLGVTCFTVIGSNLYAGLGHEGIEYYNTDVVKVYNWTKMSVGLEYNPGIKTLFSVDTFLYAGGARNEFYRSSLNAKKWVATETNPNVNNINSFAVKDSSLFIATDYGIYRSFDQGKNLTRVDTQLSYRPFISLAVYDKAIFAGSINEGLLLSTDNGNTWLEAKPEMKNKSVQCLLVSGKELFVGTNGTSMWKYDISDYTGISENENLSEKISSTLVIYPNPATNSITIDRTSQQFPENTPVHYTLSTLVGGKVMEFDNSEPKFTVSLGGIASGVYCLTAERGANKAAVMVTVVE